MSGKVVLSLMNEDPWNGFVRITAWLILFDLENNDFTALLIPVLRGEVLFANGTPVHRQPEIWGL
ncbi:MAG: hypothetical protein ABSH15_10290 [Verrucomicrobiota bacterium]|jgi:hypothetical protein